MMVSDVARYLEDFAAGTEWEGFGYTLSDPWHLGQWKEARIPFESDPCIYLLTEPATPDWAVPLGHNQSNVWYVGKSIEGGSRIWKHLGEVNDPGAPRFHKHRWQTALSVPSDIRADLAEAKAVAYVVKLEPHHKRALPVGLEKYVLARLYQSYGAFPPLNLEE